MRWALSFRGIAMKRLVLCFDGTWNAVNDPDTVTNVVKFAQSIKPTASDGTKQIVYYNSGVAAVECSTEFLAAYSASVCKAM
jgi:uncharacterized protein (DUF2235 family)